MANNLAVWHYPDAVTGHTLARNVLSSLKELSERDYPGGHYFACDVPALDMDSYETSLRGENRKTADAVVGICNERQGQPADGRLLLVELRMDYRCVSNLSVTSLLEKESHTRELLRACPDDRHIDPSYCLIFDYKIEQQAYSWMSRIRKSNRTTKLWKTFSPRSFVTYINVDKTMPYTPRQETVEVEDRFRATVQAGDIGDFDRAWSAAENYILKCARRNEFGECAYLSAALTDAVALFDADSLDDESDQLYFDIIKDDLLKLAARYMTEESR